VIAVTGYAGHGLNPNIAVALGGIIAAGALYAAIGLAVIAGGDRLIELLMPPVVTGSIVAVIGLNLAPIAVKEASGSALDTSVAVLTVVAVGVIALRGSLLRRVPVLLGGLIGYVVYAVLANGLGWASRSTLRRWRRRPGSAGRSSPRRVSNHGRWG
jgi:putative pyrimidine permease RutG